jgi:replication factor C subunit 1
MDIRSFFQPKKAAKAAPAASDLKNGVNNSNKEDETARKRKSPERLDVSADDFFSKTTTTKKIEEPLSSSKKAKREILIDSSSEEEVTKVVAVKTAVVKKPTTPVKPPAVVASPQRSMRTRTPIKTEATPPTKKAASPVRSATTKKSPRTLEQPTVRRTTPPSLQHTQCLMRDNVPLTFCFSGVLEQLSREAAQDLVKMLGGRVTTAVSSKTDYLVVGSVLEDGRDYQQGSKYKKAMELKSVVIVQGEELFYGLLQTYHDLCGPVAAPATASTPVVSAPPSVASNPYSTATAATKVNPYAKKAANPYAATAKTNPYGRKAAPATTTVTSTVTMTVAPVLGDTSSMLWVDKYKPTCAREILGNQDAVKKLTQWLNSWERIFNTAQNSNKTFSAPNGPWKAALLSGPPGIGSTYDCMCTNKYIRNRSEAVP